MSILNEREPSRRSDVKLALRDLRRQETDHTWYRRSNGQHPLAVARRDPGTNAALPSSFPLSTCLHVRGQDLESYGAARSTGGLSSGQKEENGRNGLKTSVIQGQGVVPLSRHKLSKRPVYLYSKELRYAQRDGEGSLRYTGIW